MWFSPQKGDGLDSSLHTRGSKFKVAFPDLKVKIPFTIITKV